MTLLISTLGVFTKYWPVFLQGLLATLLTSFVVVLFGTLLGILLSTIRLSKYKLFAGLVETLVSFLRGTPLLLQLYFFYFALPQIVGMDIPKEVSIIMALILNSSAYVCEIFRAGIQAVDPGQREAAESLGLREKYIMLRIIIPQAIKNILPALGNEFVTMIKETSLASTFYVADLMTSYRIVMNASYKAVESLIILALVYFALTYTSSRLVGVLERKLMASV